MRVTRGLLILGVVATLGACSTEDLLNVGDLPIDPNLVGEWLTTSATVSDPLGQYDDVDLIAAGAPSFVLVSGDLSYGDSKGADAVDQHFIDVMAWSQDAAYLPAWGNHDWGSANDDLRNYKGRFDFPNSQTSPGSPAISCCGEDWFWFDYGNVRFIAGPEEACNGGQYGECDEELTPLGRSRNRRGWRRGFQLSGHRNGGL